MRKHLFSTKTKVIAGVIAIAIVVVLVVVLWLTSEKRRNERILKKATRQAKRDIEKSNLSMPQYEIDELAARLFTAMNGFGTNTGVIYRVFEQMQTLDDVKALVASFGVREGETLAQWLQGEKLIRLSKINSILEEKGINYKF